MSEFSGRGEGAYQENSSHGMDQHCYDEKAAELEDSLNQESDLIEWTILRWEEMLYHWDYDGENIGLRGSTFGIQARVNCLEMELLSEKHIDSSMVALWDSGNLKGYIMQVVAHGLVDLMIGANGGRVGK